MTEHTDPSPIARLTPAPGRPWYIYGADLAEQIRADLDRSLGVTPATTDRDR